MNENEQLNNTACKYKEQTEDLQQKKNRLNFLLFLCMKQGCPVSKIYNEEVKPIDSHRFDLLTPSKYKKSIQKLNEEIRVNKITKVNFPLNESFEQLPESFFEELDQSEED